MRLVIDMVFECRSVGVLEFKGIKGVVAMNTVQLAHGSGGKLTHDLIKDLFVKYFDNEYLSPLSDSAEIRLSSKEIVFTTDSYVVKPLVFPGGDIGKLAICGTVNDLSVAGGTPLFISCGFIIEEGFALKALEEIVQSMAATVKEAGVKIVTGDTKVVEKGAADGLFINTAGIGQKVEGLKLGYDQIRPGDKIIVNGNIGDHGMAVMAERENLGLSSNLISDCAPLNDLIKSVCEIRGTKYGIRFMRDPTRGGLATTLCEVAEETGFEMEIDETSIPISNEVKGIAEILGIDPLYSANEGKVVIIASADSAGQIVSKMKNHPLGKNARIIGEINSKGPVGKVTLKTGIGTRRLITMPTGPQLPRIC